jgi:hypothetical protein
MLVNRGAICGASAAEEVWSSLLLAPDAAKEQLRALHHKRERAGAISAGTGLPQEIVNIVAWLEQPTWVDTVEFLIYGATGSLPPSPAPTNHLNLTVTHWRLHDDKVKADTTNHTRDVEVFDRTVFVERTTDSLFVRNNSDRMVTVQRVRKDITINKKDGFVRVPMTRHPVILLCGDRLVTIAPSEYPRETPLKVQEDFGFTSLLPLENYWDIFFNFSFNSEWDCRKLTFMLQAGVNMHRVDLYGSTLLHELCTHAALNGSQQEGVETLLPYCDVNATDRDGQTALYNLLLLSIPHSAAAHSATAHSAADMVVFNLPLVGKLLQAGAIFGRRMDAKVRAAFLLVDEHAKTRLCQVVLAADGAVDEAGGSWETILHRLIYGQTRVDSNRPTIRQIDSLSVPVYRF